MSRTDGNENMDLLDPTVWTENIYSGQWRHGGGGRAGVTEPATGDELGQIGIADRADEAAALAAESEYGLSLGILTKDVMAGLALAEKIPSGLVHINDQTVTTKPS